MTIPIETKRLQIVTFSEHHLTKRYVSWLNDPEVVKYSEQRHRHHTLESCREYYESFKCSENLFLAIELKDNARHIGNMNVYMDSPNGLADIGIMLGDRSEWGKGYASEAWNAVLNYLLEDLNIRKVTAGTMACNKAMLKVMERSGMTPDGIRKRQMLVDDGKTVNLIFYAIFNHKK